MNFLDEYDLGRVLFDDFAIDQSVGDSTQARDPMQASSQPFAHVSTLSNRLARKDLRLDGSANDARLLR